MDTVENKIVEHYAVIQASEEFTDEMRGLARATLDDQNTAARDLHTSIRKELSRLDVKEENLLDLAADSSLPQAKIRSRLTAIGVQRARLQEELTAVDETLEAGAQLIQKALDLLADPQSAYRVSTDSGRQLLNAAFWDRFEVDSDGVQTAVLKPPFDELDAARRDFATWSTKHGSGARGQEATADTGEGTASSQLVGIVSADVSSKPGMVEVLGRYSKQGSTLARLHRLEHMRKSSPSVPRAHPALHIHKVEQRLDAEALTQLVADYTSGVATTVLMEHYSLGKGTVLRVLRRAGVEMRNQGVDEADLPRMVELYGTGWSLKRLGAEFSCDAETVRKALLGADVTMRKPWERPRR